MSSDPSHDEQAAGTRKRGLARLKPRPGSAVPWAALAGLLGAGAAISVGELIAGITDRTPSLVLGVSDAIVDSRFVPGAAIRWSIDTFGSAQKPLLYYGVLAATLVLGVLTGIAARRHRWVILVVFAAFGTVGGLASNAGPTATTSMAALTAALAVVVGGGALWGMLRLISPVAPAPAGDLKPRQPHPYLNESGRRWFLTAAGATAVGALAASGVGRYLIGRRGNVEAGRASVADLLSSAEVRSDAGGTSTDTPATTIAGGTTPTTAGGGPAAGGRRHHQTDQRARRGRHRAHGDRSAAGHRHHCRDDPHDRRRRHPDHGGRVSRRRRRLGPHDPGTRRGADLRHDPAAGRSLPFGCRRGGTGRADGHPGPRAAIGNPGTGTSSPTPDPGTGTSSPATHDPGPAAAAEPGGLLRQHGQRHLAHRDAELGLLPHRHRTGGALGGRGQLDARHQRHGRQAPTP